MVSSFKLSTELNIREADLICQHYLSLLYRKAPAQHAQKKILSETYGEILFPSVAKIFSQFPLSKDDVFFDLGSGLGKLAIQVFLQSDAKEVCGIEIVSELHQHALMAMHSMQNEIPEFFNNERKLNFISGDFLKTPLEQATVLMICAPCYTQNILLSLGDIINHNSCIHTVFTLRPIINLRRLILKKIIRIECSFDTSLCYVYQTR